MSNGLIIDCSKQKRNDSSRHRKTNLVGTDVADAYKHIACAVGARGILTQIRPRDFFTILFLLQSYKDCVYFRNLFCTYLPISYSITRFVACCAHGIAIAM
eukprot:sb/3478496/